MLLCAHYNSPMPMTRTKPWHSTPWTTRFPLPASYCSQNRATLALLPACCAPPGGLCCHGTCSTDANLTICLWCARLLAVSSATRYSPKLGDAPEGIRGIPLSSLFIGNFTWSYIFIHHMICVLLGASCHFVSFACCLNKILRSEIIKWESLHIVV